MIKVVQIKELSLTVSGETNVPSAFSKLIIKKQLQNLKLHTFFESMKAMFDTTLMRFLELQTAKLRRTNRSIKYD